MPDNASSNNGRLRRILGRVVAPAFYLLLVVFVVIYVVNTDWSQLQGVELSWWPLIAATLLSLAFRYLGVFIWLRLLMRLGGRLPTGQSREMSYIYAKSWLGRYIPGAATWILGKIYFASRHGVPRDKLAVSGVLEGALQIVATMIVGIALVIFDPRAAALAPWIRWLLIAALIVGIVALIPPVFHRLLRLAFKVLRRGDPDKAVLPSWVAMGEATGWYVLGSLVTGTSYFLVVLAVYPEVNWSDALYIIGAASLASAISMLAIFAPGGLGVREGVLGLMFAVVMPGPVALVLVIVLRVWSVAVDFLFYFVTLAIRGRPKGAMSDDLKGPAE